MPEPKYVIAMGACTITGGMFTPGGLLASVYHLTRIEYGVDQPEEVCIKVFASRRNPRIPSVFWVWKSVDFQERESYDMLGISYDNHPRLKRILMPESCFI
nr:ClpP1 [Campsis grandiflora]